MKAAGLVAGISNAMRDFWLYDVETRRNSTKEDFIRRFSECYTMNALSVQMQYDDPAPETDSNEYRERRARPDRCSPRAAIIFRIGTLSDRIRAIHV